MVDYERFNGMALLLYRLGVNGLKRIISYAIMVFTLFSYNIAFASSALDQGFAPVDVVYHGSPNTSIKIFEPKSEHVRDLREGPVVFATPSIRFSSCYLFRWDDSWVHQSISWENNKADKIHMVISDRKRFEKLDSGGSIYLLPSDTFTFNKDKELRFYEWTSKVAVAPFAKIYFTSTLEAMKTFGVMVYFLDEVQFKLYLALSGSAQEEFLTKFKPY
ncbi:MAG: hypothetical protein KA508_06300 [Gammaproteobacteria bacterium]|nr:hypothetical protein [Gammaproteobacteria bacterium]